MQKFYTPAVQSQRQVYTLWNMEEKTESCNCPFCGQVNKGEYKIDFAQIGYIAPVETCKHFNMFMMADNHKVSILFYGSSADLKEEEN